MPQIIQLKPPGRLVVVGNFLPTVSTDDAIPYPPPEGNSGDWILAGGVWNGNAYWTPDGVWLEGPPE